MKLLSNPAAFLQTHSLLLLFIKRKGLANPRSKSSKNKTSRASPSSNVFIIQTDKNRT